MGVVAFASVVGAMAVPETPGSALPKLDLSGNHRLASEFVRAETGLVTTYADDGEKTGDMRSEWGEYCPGLRVPVGTRGNKECK